MYLPSLQLPGTSSPGATCWKAIGRRLWKPKQGMCAPWARPGCTGPLLRMGNLVPPPFPPSASGTRTSAPLSHPPTCSGEQPLHPLCHSPPHSSQSALKAHPCFANLVSLWGCTGRSNQRLDSHPREAFPPTPALLPGYCPGLAWQPWQNVCHPPRLGMRKLQDLAATSSTSDQENTRLRD